EVLLGSCGVHVVFKRLGAVLFARGVGVRPGGGSPELMLHDHHRPIACRSGPCDCMICYWNGYSLACCIDRSDGDGIGTYGCFDLVAALCMDSLRNLECLHSQ